MCDGGIVSWRCRSRNRKRRRFPILNSEWMRLRQDRADRLAPVCNFRRPPGCIRHPQFGRNAQAVIDRRADVRRADRRFFHVSGLRVGRAVDRAALIPPPANIAP